MKVAEFFAAAEQLPIATLDDVTQSGLVVVAPHPDDESLGCGGLIAEACARGREVRLLILTDGCGSHPGSRLFPPGALRKLREEETCHAAAALGLPAASIHFLRLPDRYLTTKGSDAEAACAAIVAVAADCQAGAVCVTWARDPHCDHQSAAALVDRVRSRLGAARVFAYPIWGQTLPVETEVGAPEGFRFSMAHHVAAKRRAIAAHQSQTTNLINDDPDGFRLSPEMVEQFLKPYEILLAIGCETADP